jgi:hypothetical protein
MYSTGCVANQQSTHPGYQCRNLSQAASNARRTPSLLQANPLAVSPEVDLHEATAVRFLQLSVVDPDHSLNLHYRGQLT